MTTREAAIKVSLAKGDFVSGMKSIEGSVKSAGTRMSAALGIPLSAGLNSAKKSLSSFGQQLKTSIGYAATLGGAIGLGKLIKDGIQLNSVYRSIAFTTSKIPDQMMTWQEVNKLITDASDTAQVDAKDLAQSFHEIVKATGDMKFAKDSIEAIGVAANGSYESIDNITQAAQLMRRKFGIGSDDIRQGLATFIQLTGVGGKGMADLSNKFGVMAGLARESGMEGTKGLGELLGMLIMLDDAIGEKADPALTMMFQQLRKGSSDIKALEKAAKIKFKPDTSGLDKIKKLLTTKAGRAAAEIQFKGNARAVFDTLAAPFDLAMEEAQKKGMGNAEALDYSLAAFDAAIRGNQKQIMTWTDLERQAADNVKNDPSIQLRQAIDRIGDVFEQPKMISAINKLADKLPVLADAVADFAEWAVDNPWSAAAVVGGGKVGLDVAGGAVGAAVPSLLKYLFGFGGKKVAGEVVGKAGKAVAGTAAGAALPAAAAKAGVVWRGLATAWATIASRIGAAAAIKGTVAAGGAAGAGAMAIGGGAALAGGIAIGTGISENVTKPMMAADFERLDTIDSLLEEIKRVRSDETSTLDQKEAALLVLKERMAELKSGPGAWTGLIGEITAMFSDVAPAQKEHTLQLEALAAEEMKLKEAIADQSDAWGTNKKGLSEFAQSVLVATESLRKMGGSGKPNGSVSGLPVKPGSTTVGPHD